MEKRKQREAAGQHYHNSLYSPSQLEVAQHLYKVFVEQKLLIKIYIFSDWK